MAIPPFPSQDLAKLVLGYLAEEQLMTAYDEFLTASPYLDVFRNEYDRIFMTSLKSILAEYRAVKIYVETCKPFLLRKKLVQCSNLLEIVRFLVNHVDINRLQAQEPNTEKLSSIRYTSHSKSNVCEVCRSLCRGACECRPRPGKSAALLHPRSQTEVDTPKTSTETTSLANLPGNSRTTEIAHSQSNVVQQILQNSLVQPISLSSGEQISQSSPAPQISQRSSVQQILQGPFYQQVSYMTARDPNVRSCTGVRTQTSVPNIQNNTSVAVDRQHISVAKSDEAKQKIEEFNTIFDLVCSNNSCTVPPRRNNVGQQNDKLMCSAGSFQEFATGVTGNSDKEKPTVPDSSTSENFNSQTTLQETRNSATPITNIKGPPVGQYFLRSGTVHSPFFHVNQNSNTTPKNHFIRIKEKPDDQKVTILSDVKVDNSFQGNNYVKMPQVLRSNTSNPMMQMQTIFINGTPAFTNKRQTGSSLAYTKDEIMAMPTIIVVPSSGLTQSSAATYSQSNFSCSTSTVTTTKCSTPRVLGPLVIDVPSNSPPRTKITHLSDVCTEDPKKVDSEGLVKTVDVTTVSLPKDSNIAVPNKTSTPNAAPPTRKSSSTPRRNSHVRVLDFATPRRILHEAINENDPNQQTTESSTNEHEIISKGPSDIPLPVHTNVVKDDTFDKAESNKSKHKSTKENKTKTVKKSNWDAELRALVVGKETFEEPVATPKPKPKKAKKKKKAPPVAEHDSETSETTNSTSHTTTKSNESIKSVENVEQPIEVTSKSSVPETANRIKECDGSADDLHATQSKQIKVNTSDDAVDTPEAERLSLQNAIGAKLNISDLLETPYKQVFYDIQMDTPKFLGCDLPDEPVSDIKIMSIPTPLFLTTPKPLQATPSSYSSRPTDYSSGSSYYKPDDHDYVPPSEVLQCTGNVTVDTVKSSTEENVSIKTNEEEKSGKSSRPQRKCTRNVSYRSPNICKTKCDESLDAVSLSSEASNKSTKDKKANKSVDSKARLKSKTKHEKKKNVVVYKSPLRTKNFMKIKPRRATPVKSSSDKGRKKTSDLTENCASKSRNRTTSKDKNTNTSIIVAAPTKSRRKSSTPRKLNCTKPFTVFQSPCILPTVEQGAEKETNAGHLQDSDTEQMALRWSDDCSEDPKPKDKEEQPTSSSIPDEDDITKIKEYIETSAPPKLVPDINGEGSLQNDLIKRGFDAETAKIIERDLLDTTPIQDTAIQSTSNEETSVKNLEVSLTVSDKMESGSSTVNNLHIVQEEDEFEEVELSVHDCNEDSKNFFSYQFDEATFIPSKTVPKLRDQFSVELCVDDGLTIRLRANPFTSLFDMEPEEQLNSFNHRETEDAVSSISNIDKLYTPMKDVREQCYDIFDSTLTSIDTPLKSEVTYESKVTEIVLEVEREDVKEKTECKKRKRVQSGGALEESLTKKSKPDAQYLANIQNIDIESVLSKLHGP